MEIKDLETFLLIVNTGSFTEAAKTLFLTQPGISRRIRHLEDELQGKLFEKVGNSLIVTPAGRELIPYAEEVLQAVTRLKRTFERIEGRFNTITIALSSTLAGTSFSSRFKDLQSAFPNVENFTMRILNDDDLSQSVLKGESDMGIRFFKDDKALLDYHLLRDDPFVLVRAAKSQWFTSDQPVTLEQISAVPWLTLTSLEHFFDPITTVSNLTDSILQQLGIELRHTIECYGWGVTKNLVEQDHGISFLPFCKVDSEVVSQQLAILDLPVQSTIPIYGVHRKHDVHAKTWQEILHFLAQTQ